MNEDTAQHIATNILSRFEKAVTGHGPKDDPEYRVWQDLIDLLVTNDPGAYLRKIGRA